tara:strand:+ start:79 stop:408 length:330 start_codon:yes stop_codon:yes gene_type:complete
MTDEAPKKRRGRPSKKKVDQELAPAFLQGEKKRGPGRPFGAKTEERPTVEVVKTPCVHCGKTDLKIVRTGEPIKVCHRVQGKTFNTLVRKLSKCGNCLRHNSVNVFEIR